MVELYIYPSFELGEHQQHTDSNICNRLTLYKQIGSKKFYHPLSKNITHVIVTCAVHANTLSDKGPNLSIIQTILLKLWQIIGKMYNRRSCNFHESLGRHSSVIEKFYDLLGRPSYGPLQILNHFQVIVRGKHIQGVKKV